MATRVNRTKKSNTRAKKTKVSIKAPWYMQQRTVLFVLTFAVIGVAGLFLARAATDNNCVSVTSDTNSTMKVCVNQPRINTVNATADYTGGKGTFRLKTATLSLYSCVRDTNVCATSVTSSAIKKPNWFVPSKARVTTASISFDTTKTYKACVNFTDSIGWQQAGVCTDIIDFAPPTQQSSEETSTSTTTTTTSAPDCGMSPQKEDGSLWKCTFNEDFNGTTYDRTKWVPQLTATSGFSMGTAPGRTCFVNNANTIRVSDGYLNLSVNKTSQPFTCAPASKGAFTTSYESGQLMTYRLFSQQYGRFEVRAKLPTERKKGLQETFWLWPNDSLKYGPHPASGEIDMGEFYSQYPDFNVPYIHYKYDSYNSETDSNIVTLLNPKYNRNYDNCKINFGEFNTYTAVWRSGYIQLDVNGKPCVVNNYTSTVGPVPAPFDQPFFLSLTQALGIHGNAYDESDPPKLPATTQVDYVKIWQ